MTDRKLTIIDTAGSMHRVRLKSSHYGAEIGKEGYKMRRSIETANIQEFLLIFWECQGRNKYKRVSPTNPNIATIGYCFHLTCSFVLLPGTNHFISDVCFWYREVVANALLFSNDRDLNLLQGVKGYLGLCGRESMKSEDTPFIFPLFEHFYFACIGGGGLKL